MLLAASLILKDRVGELLERGVRSERPRYPANALLEGEVSLFRGHPGRFEAKIGDSSPATRCNRTHRTASAIALTKLSHELRTVTAADAGQDSSMPPGRRGR